MDIHTADRTPPTRTSPHGSLANPPVAHGAGHAVAPAVASRADPAPLPDSGVAGLSEAQIDLVRRQREAEPQAAAAAARKLQERTHGPNERAVRRLFDQARKAPRATKRIRLILQAASTWGEGIAPLAACRRTCSACCHLPVPITSAEARYLSSVSGRPLSLPAGARRVRDHVDHPALPVPAAIDTALSPCPFLEHNACSVYEARPMTCRTHFSLADSSLLCQVVPGHPARVPYANALAIRAHALMLQAEETLADIRRFFPPGEPEAHARAGWDVE